MMVDNANSGHFLCMFVCQNSHHNNTHKELLIVCVCVCDGFHNKSASKTHGVSMQKDIQAFEIRGLNLAQMLTFQNVLH